MTISKPLSRIPGQRWMPALGLMLAMLAGCPMNPDLVLRKEPVLGDSAVWEGTPGHSGRLDFAVAYETVEGPEPDCESTATCCVDFPVAAGDSADLVALHHAEAHGLRCSTVSVDRRGNRVYFGYPQSMWIKIAGTWQRFSGFEPRTPIAGLQVRSVEE
jgi:hypothetical protein